MSETEECPLCMEVMEIDDLNFFPCSCGYQICRFCWHRIRTDENGLCPACRKTYSENPAMYQPLSQDEIQKKKKERKQHEVQRKQKISESRKHLSNVRVIQKNLLFVVGLSQRLADPELLRKPEYFGKYGKILKVIVNPSTNYAGPQGPSASAYITYSKDEENLRAILAVNNIQQDGRTLRVSLGTTKYCTHFLRNMQCKNQDCMYLHEMGDDNACFTKEDMQQGKHLAYERDLLENFKKSLPTRRKSQEIEQDAQQQREDWSQEVSQVSPNSALPAKAAWADKDGEKEKEQDDDTDDVPLASSWASASEIPHYTLNSTEEDNYTIPSSSYTKTTSSFDSNFPEKILHPTFATGWATSEETKPLDSFPPEMTEIRNDASYAPPLWPLSDLGLKNLQVNDQDDLGFDPFDECNKGLADLLANEDKAYNNGAQTDPRQTSWQDKSSDPFAKLTKNQQYSLFGDATTGPQTNALFGSYLNASSENRNTVDGLMSPGTLFASTSPTKQFSHQKNPYSNKDPDLRTWQDELRALLPNVKISFSGSLTSGPTDVHKSPWEDQTNELSSIVSRRAPPGFGNPNSNSVAEKEKESLWSRLVNDDKKKNQPSASTTGKMTFANQVADVKPVPGASVHNADIQYQPATAWNAVVGRSQQQASHPSIMQDSNLNYTQMASRVQKEEDLSTKVSDPKSSMKPVSVFPKVGDQKNQKPTAKVKPQMKYVAEDLVSSANSRNAPNGSLRPRMNDLDDISLSDPLPLSGNNLTSASNTNASTIVKNEAVVSKVRNAEEVPPFQETSKKSKKKRKNKDKQETKASTMTSVNGIKGMDKDAVNRLKTEKGISNPKGRKDKSLNQNDKNKEDMLREPIKIQQRPKPTEPIKPQSSVKPDPPKIRILKTETPNTSAVPTMTQASPSEGGSKGYPGLQEGHEVFSRLAESTEKLLQTVLSETEVIKTNTEQISKDLKTALEKCKESPLSIADLEKINYLLSTPMINGHLQGKQQRSIDTQDLERQVESARKEAEILEMKLNDVIRKNMASEVENFIKKDGGKRK